MRMIAGWVLLIGCWLLVPAFRAAARSLLIPGAPLRVRLGRGALCASFLAGFPLLSGFAVVLFLSLAAGMVNLFVQPLQLALELFR